MKNIFLATFTALALTLIATADSKLTNFSGDVMIRTTGALDSKNTKPGATWDGSVVSDVFEGRGLIVARGAHVEGIVEEVRGKNGDGVAMLALRVVSVDGEAVKSAVYRVEGAVTTRKASRTVPGWALSGALVGGVLHGANGAWAGAATGAGIGALRAGGKVKSNAVLPSESVVIIRLIGKGASN